METWDENFLPPLPELLPKIPFDVYGLSSPYLSLQLRSLHYGVDEEGGEIVGLGLFYAQQYQGSSQVLAVESSRIPANIPDENHQAKVAWSWTNLITLRDQLSRLLSNEPIGLLKEEQQEERFQENLKMIKGLQWARLTRKTAFPQLLGLEMTRAPGGDILGRRLVGRDLLLIVSVGLNPEDFLEAAKLLVPLGELPEAIQRHQEEFERITEE